MNSIATVSISVVGVAVGIAALAWARDRFRRFARIVEFLGPSPPNRDFLARPALTTGVEPESVTAVQYVALTSH